MGMTVKSDSFEGFLKVCDELIRGGKMSAAVSHIRKLNLAQVAPKHRLALARICRRSGLMTAGLKLLTPAIRGESLRNPKATLPEICEYAVLLSRVGLAHEALALLEKVDSTRAPEAELFRGYCHIMSWDYELAIGPLERFIQGAVDPYQTQIAKVNLAASYVASGRHQAAEDLLDSLIDQLRRRNAQRLIGNCLELRAQTRFYRGQIEPCRRDLHEAEQIFASAESYDQLLVRKWLAYLEAVKTKSAGPMLAFRAEAMKRLHWESVRDADLFALKIKFNQRQMDHLFFGTPFAAYRDRILREVKGQPSPWYDFGGANQQRLDLLTGEIHGALTKSPCRKVHQLIGVLLRDFYLPSRVGSVFAGLYPTEYFDIHSSPIRVRQVMRRLRRYLESSGADLHVETRKGTFRFINNGAFAVRIPLGGFAMDPYSSEIEKLRRQFQPGQEFFIGSACEKIGLSRSTFHRLVEHMVASGQMRRLGIGKATRYKLVNPTPPDLIKVAA